MTTDHAATVRAYMNGVDPVPEDDAAQAALDALVAERDEALRLRDKSDEAHHREYAGRMAAEADRDALAAALREFVDECGIVADDPRLGYVEIQINPGCIERGCAALASVTPPTQGNPE